MAIRFKVDSTTAEGTFIRVLRDGQPFAKILDVVGRGLYQFYEADHEKLGSADLKIHRADSNYCGCLQDEGFPGRERTKLRAVKIPSSGFLLLLLAALVTRGGPASDVAPLWVTARFPTLC